ncbi:MAG: branched-chain amino acid aminotransferase [Betaproteobacteria bacterium]|nr:MAG: branched-chain amino acid aminotransferase [Betaproteobacteria bacterium]
MSSSRLNIRIEPLANPRPARFPEALGFGRYFSNRMFTQRYSPEKGWHDAAITAYQPLTLDPASAVLHCGQDVFEGVKAYRRADGRINLFRIDQHMARFNRSAARMGMPQIDAALHIEAIKTLVGLEHEWIPTQPGAALYIRPVMVSSETTLEVRASQTFLHFIILSPVGPYFGSGLSPVPVFISHDYVRAVRGGTGEAKTTANYAGSLLATEQARKNGFQQVLWLDAVERRLVEEVGGMNIAFVYEGKRISTPALSGSILPGVTRDSILLLAPDMGLEVSEDRIDVNEMLADIESGHITEVFAMGTGAVVAPVGQFRYKDKDYLINGNQTGPVAQRLFNALTDIQYGRVADPYGWTQSMETVDATAMQRSASA